MPKPICFHRWCVIKRWQDKDGFHAVQKCRRCQEWKRTDIAMTGTGPLKISHEFEGKELENKLLEDQKPTIEIKNIDTESGEMA